MRRLVENTAAFNIRDARRRGLIAAGAASVRLRDSLGNECTVELFSRRRGQIAGARMFFRCPGCWRNCEILYSVGARLACRKCHRLAYTTENAAPVTRRVQRLFKIRRKLGQEAFSTFDPHPEKANGMRWRTYDRLIAELEHFEEVHFGTVGPRLARLLARHSGRRTAGF